MTRRPRSLALLLLAIAGASLGATGCLDGPLARVNPLDPGAEVSLSILGGADTLRTEGQLVLFQLVTDPVTVGRQPLWISSDTLHLASLGHGQFVVSALPVAPVSVEARAWLGTRFAVRDVVILPAP